MAQPARAMHELVDRFLGSDDGPTCDCTTATDGATLAVDATDCDGRLEAATACRAAVAEELCTCDVERIRVRSAGVDRFYEAEAIALLTAAGRFAALAREAAPTLAERAPGNRFPSPTTPVRGPRQSPRSRPTSGCWTPQPLKP